MTVFNVVYPSGQSFELRGEFAVFNVPSVGRTPVIADSDRMTTFLDPRAVVTVAETGVVVYSVEMLPSDEFTQDMRRAIGGVEQGNG